MRKVLSFVLVLSLVLGSFGMAFAAPLSDMAGEESAEAVSVLTQLGVVKGYPDGTYKPENIVTRAEMAVIVVSALGLADYATGTSSFSDMGGHWSNSFVAYATSLGVIAGYPDGTFRPDKTVSYDEAATMLVAALGYTPDSLQGTWPANYVVKAKSLGILDGITAGVAGANRGDIAIMAYQTLDQEIGSTNKDGEWKASGTEAKPDTMLTRLGAVEFEAKVIDGTEASAINLKSYVGAYASVYRDGAKETDDIIAIKEVESVFLTGDYTSGKFEADDDVDYNISNALAGVDEDNKVAFFDNGEQDGTQNLKDKVSDVVIAVDVSGKTIKDIYSISKWTVTKDEQVSKSDLGDITAKTPKLLGEEFVLDDNDEIDLKAFDLRGVDSLDKIAVDNIVYVYSNDDGIARIEVGTKVVTGKITKISEATDKKYTIDGKEYKLSSEDGAISGTDLKIKDEVKAFLDYSGNIYASEKISGEADKIAVLLAYEAGAKKFDNDRVKLFLPDGTSKIFEADVDDLGDFEEGMLVKYGVDKDGVIDSLKNLEAVVGDSDISAKGYYAGRAIDSDAVIFTYNEDLYALKDELGADDFGTTTLAKVKDTKAVDAWYSVNSDGLIDAMVMSGGDSDDEIYGFITARGYNDSDAEHYLTMLVDGEKVTYDSKSLFSAVDMKTLVKVEFNAAGEVKGLVPYGAADETTADAEAKLSGNVITVGDDKYTLDSDAVVYVKDGASKYKVGSKSDIRGAKQIKLYDTDKDSKDIYEIVVID